MARDAGVRWATRCRQDYPLRFHQGQRPVVGTIARPDRKPPGRPIRNTDCSPKCDSSPEEREETAGCGGRAGFGRDPPSRGTARSHRGRCGRREPPRDLVGLCRTSSRPERRHGHHRLEAIGGQDRRDAASRREGGKVEVPSDLPFAESARSGPAGRTPIQPTRSTAAGRSSKRPHPLEQGVPYTHRYTADQSPQSWAHPEQAEMLIFPWYCWVNDLVPVKSARPRRKVDLADAGATLLDAAHAGQPLPCREHAGRARSTGRMVPPHRHGDSVFLAARRIAARRCHCPGHRYADRAARDRGFAAQAPHDFRADVFAHAHAVPRRPARELSLTHETRRRNLARTLRWLSHPGKPIPDAGGRRREIAGCERPQRNRRQRDRPRRRRGSGAGKSRRGRQRGRYTRL